MFLTMLIYIAIRTYYTNSPIDNLKYLTTLGVIATFLTFLFGIIPTNYGMQKWYIMLFQISLISEIIITLSFWTLLVPHEDFMEFRDRTCTDRPVSCFMLYADHWLPLLLLLIDYAISHSVFLKRQWILIDLCSFVYLIYNFTWVKITGIPLYPMYNWYKPSAYINFFLSLLINPALFLFICWLNLKKLKMLKEDKLIEIFQNKKETENNTVEIT